MAGRRTGGGTQGACRSNRWSVVCLATVLSVAWLAVLGAPACAEVALRSSPFTEQVQEIELSEPGEGPEGVALSEDGTTAAVAMEGTETQVLVFVRREEEWVQQAALRPSGAEEYFGAHSVALSADGDTLLLGAAGDHGRGGAWVFARSGEAWTQQGEELTPGPSFKEARFGWSVALSADGSTALIGGVGSNFQGSAAWVFTRSGETWTQQGDPLEHEGPNGNEGFGISVALSDDGSNALVGAYRDEKEGAVFVFTRSGETWSLQQELKGGQERGDLVEFGASVAISGDGNTALVGAPQDAPGAAWVFTRSGTTWTQQGKKLTGQGQLGTDVALSADGDTALMGAPTTKTKGGARNGGAVSLSVRSSGKWSKPASFRPLTEGEGSFFGSQVALSGDGNTALIGGDADVWLFVGRPEIMKFSPTEGPASGGTTVTISGSHFTGATAVDFGSAPAESFTVVSPTTITAVSPPGSGPESVSVTTATGTTSSARHFTYK